MKYTSLSAAIATVIFSVSSPVQAMPTHVSYAPAATVSIDQPSEPSSPDHRGDGRSKSGKPSEPKSPTHRGDGRKIEQPESKSPTHRGDGRKVSGKDFCDAKCGNPGDGQQTGTGTRAK